MPTASPAALANLRKLEDRGRDGPVQKSCLICWDIENARIPEGVPVEDVEKAISNAFQYLQRRKRAAFLCAVSQESLDVMNRVYGREQVGYLSQHTDLILAPGGNKSKSTDTKIIKSIEEFVNRQYQEGKAANSVLVVITGDDDYTESIRHAMDVGMDVEVLHPGGATSYSLLTAIRGRANVWHHDWLEFLDYWLWTHHGVKLPSSDGATSDRGDAGWDRAGQHPQQPQRQHARQQRQQQQRQHQWSPPSSPPLQQRGARGAAFANGKPRKVWTEAGGSDAGGQHGGQAAKGGRGGGSGGARADGGSAAGARGMRPEQSDAASGEAGSSAASAGGGSGGGGGGGGADAKPAAAERVRARLRLDSLPAIRESDAPTRLLSGACTWFLEERRSRSDFFQRLQAIASEAGCKLRVGEDPQSVGEVEVECVDGDEPNPERAVQNALDELARAINDRLAQAIEDRGPMFGFQPPPPPPPPRTPKPQPYGSPGVTPCGRATPDQLAEFLRERGVDTTGGGGGGDGNGGVQGQLRAMVNAILVVEAALGLPNIPLSDGSLLVAVTGWEIGTTCPGQKRAAARDVLARRMSTSQLLAAARAREVAIAAGMEKRCVAEMLAEKILQQDYWGSGGSGGSSSPGKDGTG